MLWYSLIADSMHDFIGDTSFVCGFLVISFPQFGYHSLFLAGIPAYFAFIESSEALKCTLCLHPTRDMLKRALHLVEHNTEKLQIHFGDISLPIFAVHTMSLSSLLSRWTGCIILSLSHRMARVNEILLVENWVVATTFSNFRSKAPVFVNAVEPI
jgi:hypothetical protein